MKHNLQINPLYTGTMFVILLCLGIPLGYNAAFGINGFGPIRNIEVTIERTYEDNAGEKSHYMVVTDKGIFEVDNGWLLGMWNADELYGKIKEGRTYKVKTKGNKKLSFFDQDYPYIIEILP